MCFFIMHHASYFEFHEMYVQMNDECLYLFSSTFITMNYPIISILSSEKLNGQNFVKWKSNMNLVLICENYKFFLTEECPPKPTTNATRTVREAYDHWIQANNNAYYYMLAGMSDVL